MNDDRRQPDSDRLLMAVDVGNTRIKLGLFHWPLQGDVPEPVAHLEFSARQWEPNAIEAWLTSAVGTASATNLPIEWRIASVFRDASSRLAAWVSGQRPDDRVTELTYRDLPLRIELAEPSGVGIDRLLGAVAANRLRGADRAAVNVDLGSAITVDLISVAGAFRGGAILPGIGMAARALFEQTDLLPHLPVHELAHPPAALGASTTTAIESGLFWGAVGAVRELIARLTDEDAARPQVFLTGGAAPSVARLLGDDAAFVPHLVLAGIALATPANRS